MHSDALNAFATGLNQKQYSITVTCGLMNRLNDAELEAVLAHELTHIRNGDVRMMVIAVIIAGVISFFAEFFFRMMFYGRMGGRGSSSGDGDRKGGGGAAILIAIVLVAVAWFLSLVIRFALSRSREFLADAGAVELTKNPDAMIMALRKIEGRGELPGVTSAVMEMCIDNPIEGFADMFATRIPRSTAGSMRWCGWRVATIRGRLRSPTKASRRNRVRPTAWSRPWGNSNSQEPSREAPQQKEAPNPLPIPGVTRGPWGPVG